MKLDRNMNPDGARKYALLHMRKFREIMKTADKGICEQLALAVDLLEAQGILSYGDKPETDFFLIKLKDQFAADGLFAYAKSVEHEAMLQRSKGNAVGASDLFEYANEIMRLAEKASRHPLRKLPD